jgi:two-component system, cell cycle sensor histidine kinase and response regulator CckA
MLRKFIGFTVSQYGYNVPVAGDGEEAIEVAAMFGAPIHLVLSDVVMPAMNGCTLAATLRRWYPSIGVLLMSGLPEGEIFASALEEELTFFIRKPFGMEELAASVRAALDWRPNHGHREAAP